MLQEVVVVRVADNDKDTGTDVVVSMGTAVAVFSDTVLSLHPNQPIVLHVVVEEVLLV